METRILASLIALTFCFSSCVQTSSPSVDAEANGPQRDLRPISMRFITVFGSEGRRGNMVLSNFVAVKNTVAVGVQEMRKVWVGSEEQVRDRERTCSA